MSTLVAEPTETMATALGQIPGGNVPNRLGPRWLSLVKALFSLPSQRRLARAALQIDAVRHWENRFTRLSDAELKQTAYRLLRGGDEPRPIGVAPPTRRPTI